MNYDTFNIENHANIESQLENLSLTEQWNFLEEKYLGFTEEIQRINDFHEEFLIEFKILYQYHKENLVDKTELVTDITSLATFFHAVKERYRSGIFRRQNPVHGFSENRVDQIIENAEILKKYYPDGAKISDIVQKPSEFNFGNFLSISKINEKYIRQINLLKIQIIDAAIAEDWANVPEKFVTKLRDELRSNYDDELSKRENFVGEWQRIQNLLKYYTRIVNPNDLKDGDRQGLIKLKQDNDFLENQKLGLFSELFDLEEEP